MTTSTILVHGNEDPQTDLENAAQAIRKSQWWETAGKPEKWPLTTEEAAELLNVSGEYEVDAEDLSELVHRRIIARPGVGEDDSIEWTASDLFEAIRALEFRGQFRVQPSSHDCKKHPSKLALEAARREGFLEAMLSGVPGQAYFDIPHLLAMLECTDSREARTKLVAMLKGELELTHGVVVP